MIKKGDTAYVVATIVGGVVTYFKGMKEDGPVFTDVLEDSMFMKEEDAYKLADLLNSKTDMLFEVMKIVMKIEFE